MNQILITEKLYVTPEIKRKKRMYKIKFILSIFLICILFSYYIYAENGRNKSEEVAQKILGELDEKDKTIKDNLNDIIIVELEEREANNQVQSINEMLQENNEKINKPNYNLESGDTTSIEARLTIDKLGIDYPVFSDTSEELLKVSLNKYWGNGPNKVGNYCIVGHNYANGKMFGKLSQIQIGDIAVLKDMETEREVTYEVYNKYIVDPTDVSCTSQLTQGRKEMTLITCKNYGTQRLIVKCREV